MVRLVFKAFVEVFKGQVVRESSSSDGKLLPNFDCTLSSNCVISSLNWLFNIMPFVGSSCNSRFELDGTFKYLTRLITQ
jgi:hypothetical protein